MLSKIVAILLLFVATMVPVSLISVIVRPEVQMILGTLVVAYIVIGDALAGFIMGVAILISYLRVYSDKMGVNIRSLIGIPAKRTEQTLITDYLTPKHLEDAQSNVFDKATYDLEMKGIEGVYGEPVYGAQGMDPTMPGYDSYAPGQPFSLDD